LWHIPAVATAARDGRSRLESGRWRSAARWLPEREQRIAELEQEIERLQRTEEAIVVATGAPREREKREAAEIEAAKERDRQAYRERGWPSG
jgi:hypothetical protein